MSSTIPEDTPLQSGLHGGPIIDRNHSKDTQSNSSFRSLSNRLYLTGLIGAVTKWLGFHDTSWWLVLLPIYGQFLLLIVVLLLFLPILAFCDSGTSASDEDDPSPG